jgi:transcriptional regulator with XRE-family HTH domain
MTPAEFDTRRRLLGLSIQEAADYLGVQRRTVERWISGYSEVAGAAADLLFDLESRMDAAVEVVVSVVKKQKPDEITLTRYRSQAAVDASPHAAGLPLGAHGILIGWAADTLESAGHTVEIIWGD